VPLEISCPSCQAKFRAPEKYAGKKIKCPKCQGVITVPGAAAAGSAGAASAAPKPGPPKKPTPAATSTPKEEWYMQTEEGEQYGPVTRQELDGWAAEGRLDASCQVLCEGWEQWKWAEEVYPEIAGGEEPEPAADDNPFAGIAATTPQQDANPFSSPQQAGPSVASTPDSALGGEFTPRMQQALAQTRPWVMFMSILGFIMAGFAAIGGLFTLLGAFAVMSASAAMGMVVLVMALVIIGGASLYFFAAYYLFRYGGEIATFLRTREGRDLERAMIAQKSFWKLVGIVTAVVMALYLILFVLQLVLTATMMPM